MSLFDMFLARSLSGGGSGNSDIEYVDVGEVEVTTTGVSFTFSSPTPQELFNLCESGKLVILRGRLMGSFEQYRFIITSWRPFYAFDDIYSFGAVGVGNAASEPWRQYHVVPLTGAGYHSDGYTVFSGTYPIE